MLSQRGSDILQCATPSFQPALRKKVLDFFETEQSKKVLNYELLNIQKKSVAQALSYRYCCIFDDMGIGKTAQALAINTLGGHSTTLILCPNNVKKVWVHEIEKFTGIKAAQVYIGSGRDLVTLPPRIAQRYKFIIFNYESLVVAGKTPKILPSVFQVCSHHILDEAHYLRNAYSKRFMTYLNFLAKAPIHTLTILTGTPIDRCINEFWVYLSMMDLNPHGNRQRKFLNTYQNSCIFSEEFAEPRGENTFRGYKKDKLPALSDMLGGRFIQRKIQEVVELKPFRFQEVFLPNSYFPNLDMKECVKRFKRVFSLIQKSNSKSDDFEKGEAASDDFIKAAQKIRSELSCVKVKYSYAMAKKYLQSVGPTIVFFEFVQPLHIFAEYARREGLESLKVTGTGMKLHERQDSVRVFKQGQTPFLLATYGAMREGENLQQFQAMVMNCIPWQPLVLAQAQRRIWRIGQAKESYCVLMLCNGDAVVRNVVTNKQKMIQDIEKVFANIKLKEGLI